MSLWIVNCLNRIREFFFSNENYIITYQVFIENKMERICENGSFFYVTVPLDEPYWSNIMEHSKIRGEIRAKNKVKKLNKLGKNYKIYSYQKASKK